MYKVLTTLFLLFALVVFPQNKHVLYGERDLNPGSIKIFFDKEGWIYPNLRIENTSLANCNSSLKDWYAKHPLDFVKIASMYRCLFDDFNERNASQLNDSISSVLVRAIKSTKQGSVTFLLHGFRKAFVSKNSDTDSQEDFKLLKETFLKFHSKGTEIVEVYWDGMYDCCFSTKTKTNKALFQLFEEAQLNAEKTGIGFKHIVNSIHLDTLNIITYSLGAKVAFYSLLNLNNGKLKTPSNTCVNICLIAPAISPNLIAENYFDRNSELNFKNRDNYRLFIVYNEKDFALKKKDPLFLLFGPGPFKYGNTTLGCNCKHSASLLKQKFAENYPNSPIRLYNLSVVGKCHYMRCYCKSDNLKAVCEDLIR
jgi:hypothetical protein